MASLNLCLQATATATLALFGLPNQSFLQSNMQERALNMQSLKSDVESGRGQSSTTNNSIYKKITSKMNSKYGAFSQIKWKKGWW